jgi:hypothetical protein
MSEQNKFFLAVGLVLMVLYGCATIMHGTSQKVGISSNPSGAKVWVDNKDIGITPLFADLSRGDNHVVRIELEGFQKAELTLTRSTSGWVWGNILFGGLIGLAVDAISGGLYDLTPEQLNAELRKSGSSASLKNGEIYIVSTLRPNPSWKQIGSLKRLESN